ncbi:HK97 family phage prohead protease [Terriglobus albidus]|nr:HK97 family phage prohead protease [Terriglobus albidus]
MEHRDFNLKIKSVDDAGTFVGMASVYGNVDLGNDVVDAGAFSRTLIPGKTFPVLWQHKTDEPIGSCKVIDSRDGLQVIGSLLMSDPTAQKAYKFMREGIIKGLSIGFDTLQATYDGDIRHLTELRLWEVSIVTIPMNQAAMVTSVKGVSDADRAKHLKAISDHRKAIDRHQQGIQMHLKALLDGVDDEDDPVLEDDEDDGTKAFVAELVKLAKQASEFAAL